jgi:hypothetical protein
MIGESLYGRPRLGVGNTGQYEHYKNDAHGSSVCLHSTWGGKSRLVRANPTLLPSALPPNSIYTRAGEA